MHSMQVVEQALADAGMHKDSIDFLVLHQANQRILDSAAQRLGVPADRVVSNLAGEQHDLVMPFETSLAISLSLCRSALQPFFGVSSRESIPVGCRDR